jgi:hypothetical protein
MSTAGVWTTHLSQPTFGARETGCLNSIRSTEFADGFRKVVADSAFGEMEFVCNVGTRLAFTCPPQNLSLTIRQWIWSRIPRLGGKGQDQ